MWRRGVAINQRGAIGGNVQSDAVCAGEAEPEDNCDQWGSLFMFVEIAKEMTGAVRKLRSSVTSLAPPWPFLWDLRSSTGPNWVLVLPLGRCGSRCHSRSNE